MIKQLLTLAAGAVLALSATAANVDALTEGSFQNWGSGTTETKTDAGTVLEFTQAWGSAVYGFWNVDLIGYEAVEIVFAEATTVQTKIMAQSKGDDAITEEAYFEAGATTIKLPISEALQALAIGQVALQTDAACTLTVKSFTLVEAPKTATYGVITEEPCAVMDWSWDEGKYLSMEAAKFKGAKEGDRIMITAVSAEDQTKCSFKLEAINNWAGTAFTTTGDAWNAEYNTYAVNGETTVTYVLTAEEAELINANNLNRVQITGENVTINKVSLLYRGVYLKGNGDWDAWDREFTMTDYCTYTYTVADGLNEPWKIAFSDWNPDFGDMAFNTVGEKADINNSGNFLLKTEGETTITFYYVPNSTSQMLVEGTQVIDDGKAVLYLRGDMNGWGVEDAWKMETEDGVHYQLTGVVIEEGQYFKVADDSWGANNWGADDKGGNVMYGEPYVTAYNGGNLNVKGGVLAADYVLFNLDEKTLLIDEKGWAGIENVVVNGNNANVWYNLQGMRVNANELKAGIYINNGKKVLVK